MNEMISDVIESNTVDFLEKMQDDTSVACNNECN